MSKMKRALLLLLLLLLQTHTLTHYSIFSTLYTHTHTYIEYLLSTTNIPFIYSTTIVVYYGILFTEYEFQSEQFGPHSRRGEKLRNV